MVSAPLSTVAGYVRAGKVHVFTQAGNRWSLSQTLESPTPDSYDEFGLGVELSRDGSTLVVKSRTGNHVFQFDGAAWVERANLTYGPKVAVDASGYRLAMATQDTLYILRRTDTSWVVEARYVRVIARNYGTIPDWHPGRGDGAFIFVDEILIE